MKNFFYHTKKVTYRFTQMNPAAPRCSCKNMDGHKWILRSAHAWRDAFRTDDIVISMPPINLNYRQGNF